MIKFTWLGTATVLLDVEGEKLLFDPFFRMNKKLEQPDFKRFCEVDHIFNTHPHFDHLVDVPKILEKTDAQFHGTPTAYLRLETQGTDVEKRVDIICPHDEIHTKNAVVRTIRSKHVRNNIPIVLLTALKIICKLQFHKAIQILSVHKQFLMGGDIVAFEVNANNKKILIFGSAGYDKDADLPKDVDVLVWPYQGRTGMCRYSLPLIEKIQPKMVILDHFDNAFPPITGKVNTNRFVEIMKKKHPKIKVIVPKFDEKIEI